VVNIEQGIWWQQLLGPRVKKSKEREDSHSFSLILIENQVGAFAFLHRSRKPCEERKAHKKDGVGVVSFSFSFSFLFLFLYWKLEKLYDNNTRSTFLIAL
jgi:hypothetical protein